MNKTVVITGASKGIGLAISQQMAEQGWQVVGIARNSIASFPGELLICDLVDREKTTSMLEMLSQLYQVDAVVNNVGIAIPEPMGKINLSALDQVYQLNVRVAVQITQQFIEQMKARQWGRIVNIASRAIFGVKDRTSYAAAKCALVGCARTWALELAKFGICVNAVAPGPTETELFRQTRPKGSEAEKLTLAKIPMGRVAHPNEIAAATKFFLSEDASFITGQVLCVDGGGSL